jgi:hypothetical protein
VRKADNLPPSCADLGASTFWNPVGLFRPVMGQLYLYLTDPQYIEAKFTLEQALKSRGEQRYSSTLSLASALDGDGCSTARPDRFTPVPTAQESGWTSGPV